MNAMDPAVPARDLITARAIVFDTGKPRQLEMREFHIPASAAPGWALIGVHLAGICGSDVHTFLGWANYGLVIPGHEVMGEIVAAGEGLVDADGRPLCLGDRVVPESTIPCLECAVCRGFGSRYDKLVDYTACENYQLLGAIPLSDPIWMNGAYAEYLQTPPHCMLHRLGDDVTDEEAVLLEPLSVGVKAALKAGVTIGDVVVVEGPGPIGLACAIAARQAGATHVVVTGTDGDLSRLDLARELGATGTINIERASPLEQLLELTDGRKAERVIDTSGAVAAFDIGLRMTARNGVYTCVGGYPKDATLPLPPDYCLRHKIDIRFSHNGTNCYQLAYQIIQSHRYPIHKMVTHRYPLEQVQAALESLSRREIGQVKVVLECRARG
jgi:threonine dehydrogenase-like Zn-dependent dehydrogenase